MNTEHLIALIHEQGLAAFQDEIVASVRPAIHLGLDTVQTDQIGQSRIGGIPDLPASMAWPRYADTEYHLAFVLQINLAELPTFPDSPLGTTGMLYLFLSDGGDDPDQIVVYSGDEPLQPRAFPDEVEWIVDWYEDMIPHRLRFEFGPDIPRWATSDQQALAEHLGDDGEEKIDELARALSKGKIGKLLGHASGIGHDTREDAYVVREINPDWVYDYEQRSKLDMSQAQRWHNLLEIHSSRAVNVWFGDAGYIQVLVDDEALRRQDYSRAYVSLESS